MGEAHEALAALRIVEWLGMDPDSVCTLPDCYCDGDPHP
jgi:hypothetical protein